MAEASEYLIIEEDDTARLAERVSEHLRQGWSLHGGPVESTERETILQALTRVAPTAGEKRIRKISTD